MKLLHKLKFFIAKKRGVVAKTPFLSDEIPIEKAPINVSLNPIAETIRAKKKELEEVVEISDEKEVLEIDKTYQILEKMEDLLNGK